MPQVSLFTGTNYLIEDEGTVSAHAFLVTDGVIPEGGLVVSVDAPNLSEFDLEGISVEGGEIVAVRDGGFDLRMTEYTALVNLPVAADGETEESETASFSLAAGEGYEIVEDYDGGSFNLVDTRSDIPRGVVTEPNDIAIFATDTQITPETPSFSTTDALYFDIGNRYLNSDGTYTYIDYNEDVDLYQVELNAEDIIAVEVGLIEGDLDLDSTTLFFVGISIFDTDGNQIDLTAGFFSIPPGRFFNADDANAYLEFTAPETGDYYIGVSDSSSVDPLSYGEDFRYNIETPGLGDNNRVSFGNYEIEIDLLTEDNPRKTGTPTPPVSNPNVTASPTLSLDVSPITIDSEGNFTNAVVEFVEETAGVSNVVFTIRAEGEFPEEGIEFVLNSNANQFDYLSYLGRGSLPSTIGGQSLGAFYNEDGIPTGVRLRIDEPTMTVTLEAENPEPFAPGFLYSEAIPWVIDTFVNLETDGAEEVTFFLQPGEGYEIAPDAGAATVTYYDSLADVPPPTGGSDIIPEVGVTISETELIESEGTETTVTFTLSEPPPEEGVTMFLDSDDQPSIGSVLGQFLVLEAEIDGGNFPVANDDSSGFFFTITEQIATITLPVFDELTVIDDVLTVQEGIVALNFSLQPQPGYTIDPDASEINLTIRDTPDSQIQVGLIAEPLSLIESEGTVSVHTFIPSAPPSAEGLTVSVSAPALNEFDLDAVEVVGGTLAEVRDDGFDLTITEREAIISLPILDDGVTESSETAIFTLEPSDTYQIDQAATGATFAIVDTPDQVAGVSEEIENNDVLSEANALSLSADNPTVSINGSIFASGYGEPARLLGYSEDVDFYSVTLDAGQTLALDVDGDAAPALNFATVFPALEDVIQQTDTELRLFDAEGNELAANNDGAAPGEEFSRDPYLEFTAETAGTYYVGVSLLGNRNYDPNVVRSGSGWTFPEVGVFFGNYELTATLTDRSIEFDIIGTEDAEILVGDAQENNIDGLGGDDEIAGGLANDLILGGEGDDVLRGDLNSRKTQDSEPGGDDIIFGGEGSDRIGGKAGNDILSGDAGDDLIYGDSGDDILMGVTGDDTLVGDNFSDGSGNDLFVFGNGDGTDTILDFEVGIDFIGLVDGELVFEDLTLTQDAANTLLGVADSGETLVILNNVQASALGESDFAIVPDVSNPEEALAIV